MRAAIAIACGVVFLILAFILYAIPTSSNVFAYLIAGLANFFLIAHLLYIALAYFIIRSYLIVLEEGSHVDDTNEFSMSGRNIDEMAIQITIGFAIFLAISTVPAYKFSWDLVLGCEDWSQPCRYMGRSYGFGTQLIYGLSHLVALIYSFVMFFVIVGFGALIGATLPTFVAGVIALSHRHPAEGFMARSLEQFRSDPRAEQELLRIMESQDVRDEDIERLLGRLAPWERWYKRIEYRKRARDIRRLKEMADLKRRALEEETGFAKSVHELERARRRAGDWR